MTTSAGPRSAQLPRPGDIVAGKYVLERLLGRGGMGAVFAAKHVKLGKPVAIKVMLADRSNPEASARFVNEGRAAANIQNEHVVRVDDVDEEMGYAYMVLELLEGEDLSNLLERQPQKRLPPHLAVDYVLQALRGIIQAHAMGIVHRDLKPSNLFLAKRKDGSEVVKVLDFGISKQQATSALAASPGALTSTQAMLGSPLYMSPEQLRSSKSVDQRSDIWALGVILYELITGTLPFNGESLGELFAAILETEPQPPSQRVDGIPPGLEQIVLRCLQRRPEHRFQTASELAAALAPFAVAHGGAGATAVSSSPQSFAVTPSAATSEPHVAPPAATGSSPALVGTGSSLAGTGPQPRPVGGTVALGAATPQNLQHTTGGWQSTGGASTAAIPKTKAPLVIGLVVGVLGLFAVIGGVFIVLAQRPAAPDTTGSGGTVSATAPPPPTTISTPPTPSTPPSPSETAPVASASASASATETATAATAPATAVKTAAVPTTRPTQNNPPRPPQTTTATTKQPEPPTPKPPKTSDPTQTSR